MGRAVRCFDPSLYPPFASLTNPTECYRCIAPTATNPRCGNPISAASRGEAVDVLRSICAAKNREQREIHCQEYCLLLTCKRQHSWRIEGTSTVETIANWWATEVESLASELRRSKTTASSKASPTSRTNSSKLSLDSTQRQICWTTPSAKAAEQASPRYTTRSTLASRDTVIPQTPDTDVSSSSEFSFSATDSGDDNPPPHDEFIPYLTGPSKTVREELLTSLTEDNSKNGSVYAFTRDSSPRHVKIGYTTGTIDARLHAWEQSCKYTPKRQADICGIRHAKKLERLIHVQLAALRRRETRCEHCQSAHQEWFEVDVGTVRKVFAQWEILCRRDPLYEGADADAHISGHYGRLTDRWRHRIDKMSGVLDAAKLLQALDEEDEKSAKVTERGESAPHSVDTKVKRESDDVSTPLPPRSKADLQIFKPTGVSEPPSPSSPTLIGSEICLSSSSTLTKSDVAYEMSTKEDRPKMDLNIDLQQNIVQVLRSMLKQPDATGSAVKLDTSLKPETSVLQDLVQSIVKQTVIEMVTAATKEQVSQLLGPSLLASSPKRAVSTNTTGVVAAA